MNERGSVLMLVPAGFLVLMLLAAIAVDSAVAYQARNQLHDALATAANDAVGGAVDSPSFYSNGSVLLDTATVASVVCRSVEAQGLGSLHGLQLAVAVSGDAIRVTGRATVDAVFGRFVPGFGTRPVSSTADAVLTRGGPVTSPAFDGMRSIFCPG
jgi:Flp pilus assembly protein TadG